MARVRRIPGMPEIIRISTASNTIDLPQQNQFDIPDSQLGDVLLHGNVELVEEHGGGPPEEKSKAGG